jgi:hypothetical protein
MKLLEDYAYRVSLFVQEILWQGDTAYSHFFAVHDGKVGGAHAPILRSSLKSKMARMVL